MAQEDLMKTTPENMEHVGAYFYVIDHLPGRPESEPESRGSYSVVVSNPVLMNISGPRAKERATCLAQRLVEAWEESIEL